MKDKLVFLDCVKNEIKSITGWTITDQNLIFQHKSQMFGFNVQIIILFFIPQYNILKPLNICLKMICFIFPFL